jgi:hypothetical protein
MEIIFFNPNFLPLVHSVNLFYINNAFSLFVGGRSSFANAAVCTLSPYRRPVGRRMFSSQTT